MSRPESIIVEGAWAVQALLKTPSFYVKTIFVERGRHAHLAERADEIGISVLELNSEEISQRAGFHFHRGIFAEACRPEPKIPNPEFLDTAEKLLVLVPFADPGNVGTIVRSAAAFGVDGIIVLRGKGADIYSRKSIRASGTAIFQIPIFEVPSLEVFFEVSKENGFVLFGTFADDKATPLPQLRTSRKNAIVMGAEENGIPEALCEYLDEMVTIPTANEIDSLNVASAATVVLYELFVRHSKY